MLPAEDTLLPVGRIIKSYGTEGEVMIAFQEGIADLLKRDEPVWLFYDGLPVPFYITSIQPKGPRKAVVRLEDIDTLADAEEAAGKDIRLRNSPALTHIPSPRTDSLSRTSSDSACRTRTAAGQAPSGTSRTSPATSVWNSPAQEPSSHSTTT